MSSSKVCFVLLSSLLWGADCFRVLQWSHQSSRQSQQSQPVAVQRGLPLPLSTFSASFPSPTVRRLQALHSTLSSADDQQQKKKKRKPNNKKNKKKIRRNNKKNGDIDGSDRNNAKGKSKPNSKKKKQNFRRKREEPESRAVLFDYEANANTRINKHRLCEDINCEHFAEGKCPGCFVGSRVANIPIVDSAKMYFASTSVQQKFLASPEDYDDFYHNYEGYDDDDDEYDYERDGDDEDDDGDNQNDSVIDYDSNVRIVVPSPVTGWRTQAKLAAAPKSSSWARDGCVFGLYQRGSHKVVPIPNCPVHHPAINKAVKLITKVTGMVGTPAYSRQDHESGGLRYIQLQVERTTQKVCLTLIWSAADLKATQPALSRLVKELGRQDPDLWHGIWCHCNDGVGNNIFARDPRRWHRIKGAEFVREPLPTTDMGWLFFSPLTFRQGNMDGFDVIATDIAAAIPGGSKVCELYGGVGYLGLSALAYHAGNDPLTWLRCSDENPSNQRCFARSMDSLPTSMTQYETEKNKPPPTIDDNEPLTLGQLAQMMQEGAELETEGRTGVRAKYMVASASDALLAGQALGASVLVVDPPRKGLEPEVLQELCKPINEQQGYVESSNLLDVPDEKVNWVNDVERLIYVSCGFDALARDCDALVASPSGWMIESVVGYILFPGSDHVETVCIFSRNLNRE